MAESTVISSPIGPLILRRNKRALTRIQFGKENESQAITPTNNADIKSVLQEAHQQLNGYFAGDRENFNLKLDTTGTEFQQSVWNKLKEIPYGATITYKQLAQRLGDVNKVRAVGRANGQNPLPIIIPCHRVIGSDDQLIGYGGGIERKKWLLRHEGSLLL